MVSKMPLMFLYPYMFLKKLKVNILTILKENLLQSSFTEDLFVSSIQITNNTLFFVKLASNHTAKCTSQTFIWDEIANKSDYINKS